MTTEKEKFMILGATRALELIYRTESLTTLWFKLLEWLLVLGLLTYLHVVLPSWQILVVWIISYLLFGIFIASKIHRLLLWLPFKFTGRFQSIVLSLVIAGIINIGLLGFLHHITIEVAVSYFL